MLPAIALLLVALPTIQVEPECGPVELVRAGVKLPLAGAAPGLCVREAFVARLERDRINVVLIVERDQRKRLFIYRLVGTRLEPRYLGSGPSHLTLVRARRIEAEIDALSIETRDETGEAVLLRCAFEAFLLVCDERSER